MGATLIDHHRELRTGVPEIVYGAGKTADQIAAALRELVRAQGAAIATRVDAAKAAEVRARLPEAVSHELARMVALGAPAAGRAPRAIAVVCAGTSDLPVAEEAALVAEFLGAPVVRIARRRGRRASTACSRGSTTSGAPAWSMAVAGMEAALPSVLGGLIDRPLIAVPTSVGYGVSIDGLVALGAMLDVVRAGDHRGQHRQRRRRGGRCRQDRAAGGGGVTRDRSRAGCTCTSTARAAPRAT